MGEFLWCIFLIVFVIAFVIELFSTKLIALWISIAGLIAALAAVVVPNPWFISVIVFAACCALGIGLIRTLIYHNRRVKGALTNSDSLVNKVVIVKSPVAYLVSGIVDVDGTTWSAFSAKHDEIYAVGDEVIIIGINGVNLIVEHSDDWKKKIRKEAALSRKEILKAKVEMAKQKALYEKAQRDLAKKNKKQKAEAITVEEVEASEKPSDNK